MHRVIGSVAPVCHTPALDYELWVLWASLTHSTVTTKPIERQNRVLVHVSFSKPFGIIMLVFEMKEPFPNNPTAT